MSSLDMVAYINATRKPGEAELSHNNFLRKVPQVLKDHGNFTSIFLDSYGRSQPCYNFPRREATFMAMSYSYELQQTVYDAWQAAEARHRTCLQETVSRDKLTERPQGVRYRNYV